jgi:hypothetical protein
MRPKRNGDFERCALSRPRLDLKGSLQRLGAFLHDLQPMTAATIRSLHRRKCRSRYPQWSNRPVFHPTAALAQLAGLRMTGDVGQCLLADSQERDLDPARQPRNRWRSFLELNRDGISGLKLIDIGLQSGFQPVIVQDGRAQI